MKRFCISILLFCLSITVVTAQEKEKLYRAEFDTLAKETMRNFRIPRSVAESCKSSAVSYIVKIERKSNKNKAIKKDFQFSKNFPVELKDKILNNLVVFESIKWENFFPSTKSNGTYSFLVPMVYHSDAKCFEKINSVEFADIVNTGLSFDEIPQQPLYLLKPLLITVFKPIQ
ncbi:hypothetical protein [Chitinophaga sp. OAE865]|uniref:hypothetical protein n=1 Tax=Chitinophaga sp. OAE865 TaxID=2817898 RepID=UPI001AE91C3E